MHLRAATFDYWETLIEEREKGAAALETTASAFYRCSCGRLHLPPEPIFQEALQRRLAITRKRMTGELLEVPLDHFFPLLFEDLGISGAANKEASRGAVLFITERVHEATVVLPGAIEFLALLKEKGIKLGLVSNTQIPPAQRQESLRRLGLLPYFDAVVLSSSFIHRKPKTAIFQEALRLLQVQPEECLHFGDSLSADVEGARGAGILSVQVVAGRNATSAGEAELVIRDWRAARALFARLL
ncbi:MAG: HAD family hydrolase [Coprothermobacterota bacterium]|nr:HAD family hydrolase [Coprothermobacterota bacterium]